MFLLCAIFQFLLSRHHQKEKKFGPSPANNYTSGSGSRKFWKKKPKTTKDAYGNDTELATNGANGRHSYDTGLTGTTHGNNDNIGNSSKYESATRPGHGQPLAGPNYTSGSTAYDATHSQYGHVEPGPGPTAQNPYGYSNHPTGTAVNY